MNELLATLLGGVLALTGAWIGPYFQRKHERWRANREDQNTLREKAQELFDELDRIILDSRKAMLAAMEHFQEKQAATQPVPDLGRIRAIAAIYFPSALPLIEKFEKEHDVIGRAVVAQSKEAVDAGESGLDKLKALPLLMTSEYQKFSAKFVREMRSHLATEVPRIELD